MYVSRGIGAIPPLRILCRPEVATFVAALAHDRQDCPKCGRPSSASRATRESLHLGASDLDDAHASLFAEWIERGHHASMSYLAKNAAVRADPRERFPWARSVVSILVPYSAERPHAPAGALSHHIARYALGDDYHDVLDRILRKIEDALPGVKTLALRRHRPAVRSLVRRAGGPRLDRQERHAHPRRTTARTFSSARCVTALENDIAADHGRRPLRHLHPLPRRLPHQRHPPRPHPRLVALHQLRDHRASRPARRRRRPPSQATPSAATSARKSAPGTTPRADPHPAFTPRDDYRATPVTDLLRFTQADFSALFPKSAIKRAKLAGMQRNVDRVDRGGRPRDSEDMSKELTVVQKGTPYPFRNVQRTPLSKPLDFDPVEELIKDRERDRSSAHKGDAASALTDDADRGILKT